MFQIKKLIALSLLMMLAAMFMPVSPARADEKELRKEFEAIYAKVDEAIKNKDVKALTAMLADDFTSKEEDGKILDREQSIAAVTQSMAAIKEVHSVATKIDSLKESNGQVAVEYTQTVKATINGPDGNTHEIVATQKGRDTWVRTDRDWMIKQGENLSNTVTVDGKPVS